MRKILSIGFALIVLLNTIGYYAVFVGLHYRNDLAMSKAIDADTYQQSNTITLKVPVSIPYLPDQLNFERIDGEVEHDGELYRMVKQRYAKDTLTIICVRDTEYKKIDLALSDYLKTFTDQPTERKHTSTVSINFIKDYLPFNFKINSATEGWMMRMSHNQEYPKLTSTFSASIVHPPEKA